MHTLITCTCPECGTEFIMAQEALENVAEVSCPVCEVPFEPPTGVEDDDEDEEEDADDENEAEDEPDDDESAQDDE